MPTRHRARGATRHGSWPRFMLLTLDCPWAAPGPHPAGPAGPPLPQQRAPCKGLTGSLVLRAGSGWVGLLGGWDATSLGRHERRRPSLGAPSVRLPLDDARHVARHLTRVLTVPHQPVCTRHSTARHGGRYMGQHSTAQPVKVQCTVEWSRLTRQTRAWPRVKPGADPPALVRAPPVAWLYDEAPPPFPSHHKTHPSASRVRGRGVSSTTTEPPTGVEPAATTPTVHTIAQRPLTHAARPHCTHPPTHPRPRHTLPIARHPGPNPNTHARTHTRSIHTASPTPRPRGSYVHALSVREMRMPDLPKNTAPKYMDGRCQ